MKHNWNWKRTLIAAGLVGTLAVGVAAADAVRRTVTAEVRPDITVELNGSKQTMKDTNGNEVYALSYNGSTYLPVRAIGESLGMKVNWDSATQTVDLVGSPAGGNTSTGGSTSTGTNTGAYIGKDRAKEIALQHAGLTYENVSFIRVELDWDDGKPEYEVEFYSGSKEYDYDIDAYTGAIRSVDYDVENYTIPSGAQDIGAEAAKSAALRHAGVSASAATFVKVERDWDDGRLVYEVEFYSGNKEYDYEIAAADGTVLEYDFDAESYAPTTVSSGSAMTVENAKAIALKHAGLSTAVFEDVELDRDDGRLVYELEFKQGGMEYEYEIDAASGAVLKAEKDWD